MSRSEWGILAALAGLAALAVAFGSGLYLASLNYPDQERYPSYREATGQPANAEASAAAKPNSQTFQYRTPCSQPKGQGESDLCAQWKAARAAEDGALWTKWSVWIGIIGSTLLLWQIILTRKAVEDTSGATEAMRHANEIAERNARRESRAYVRLTLDIKRPGTVEVGKPIVVCLSATNYGLTPALNANFKHTSGLIVEGWEWGDEHVPERTRSIQTILHKDASVNCDVVMSTPLTEAQMQAIKDGRLWWVGRATYFYDDIFGEEHQTQIALEIRAADIERGSVSVSRTGHVAT